MAKAKESSGQTDHGATEGARAPEASASASAASGASTATNGSGAPSPSAAPAKPPELLKKIVAKEIIARKALIYRKDEDGKVVDAAPRLLYRVFGVAMGTDHGDSQYGPWTCFKGTFEAIRFSDRQRFQSGTCFLQDPAESMLLTALSEHQKTEPGASLSFSFDVGVKPSQRWVDTDQGNTYEYTLVSSLKVQRNDPLAALRQDIMDDLPALPAPDAATAAS